MTTAGVTSFEGAEHVVAWAVRFWSRRRSFRLPKPSCTRASRGGEATSLGEGARWHIRAKSYRILPFHLSELKRIACVACELALLAFQSREIWAISCWTWREVFGLETFRPREACTSARVCSKRRIHG